MKPIEGWMCLQLSKKSENLEFSMDYNSSPNIVPQ